MFRYIFLLCSLSMLLTSCTTTADKQILVNRSLNIPNQILGPRISITEDGQYQAIGCSQDELYHPVYNESTKEESIKQVWSGKTNLAERDSN